MYKITLENLNKLLRDNKQKQFLTALQELAKERIGMTALADKISNTRQSLYHALSKQGNPELSTFLGVIDALGLKLVIEEK